nr:MAG TPA: hypothetical protein [Caudoviricetes sp.]
MDNILNESENIKPIVTIQNRNYSLQDRDNTVNALANMGQRIGLKGDSVAYRYFTFGDLFTGKYDAAKYVGVLYYDNSTANFCVVEKKNAALLYVDDTKFEADVDGIPVYNTILSKEISKASNIPINNIEYLCPGTKFYTNKSNNTITSVGFGKIAGMLDDEQNNLELLYNRFNTVTHRLEKYVRIFHLEDVFNNKFYVLVRLEGATLSINILDILRLDSDKKYYIDEIIKRFSLNRGKPELDDSALYNEGAFNGELSSKMMTLLDSIVRNTDENEKYGLTIKCNFDENGLLGYSVDTDKVKLTDDFLSQYQPTLSVQRIIDYINVSIQRNYEFVLTAVNNNTYGENKVKLRHSIIQSLYETFYPAGKNEPYYTNTLYIPLDYKFYYVANSNNSTDIYYSNNIYIRQVKLYRNNNKNEFNKRNTPILQKNIKASGIFYFDDSDKATDKTEVYGFTVNYNVRHTNFINSIESQHLYTLPYIKDEQWTINDIDTGVNAVGRDAGMPHIIFASYFDNKFKIINTNSRFGFLDTEKQENFTPVNLYFDDVNGTVEVKVPKAYDDYHSVFRDAIMFLYMKVNTKFGTVRYLTTIWEYKLNANNSWSFQYIRAQNNDPNKDYPLELGSNIQVSQLDKLRSIKLDAKSKDLPKNTEYDPRDKSEVELSSYKNLNFSIIYRPDGFETSPTKKYLADIEVTNTDYKLISATTEVPPVTPTINVIKTNEGSTTESVQYTTVTTDLNRYIYRSYIVDTDITTKPVSPTVVATVKQYTPTVSYSEKSDSYFPEYVFKNNVPTFNLAETFLRDVNTLNRYNVISLDSEGRMYNAYMGTHWRNPDKKEFVIGTSSENINLGRQTLSDYNMAELFYMYDSLSLEFPLIKTESKATYLSNPISTHTVNGIKYNSVCGLVHGTSTEAHCGYFSDDKSGLQDSDSKLGIKLDLSSIKLDDNVFIKVNHIKQAPHGQKVSELNAIYDKEALYTTVLFSGTERVPNKECSVDQNAINRTPGATVDLSRELGMENADVTQKSKIVLYIEQYNFENDLWEPYRSTYTAYTVSFKKQGLYRICTWLKYNNGQHVGKTVYVKSIHAQDATNTYICTLININKLLEQKAGINMNKFANINVLNKDNNVLNVNNQLFLVCNEDKLTSAYNKFYYKNLDVVWYMTQDKDASVPQLNIEVIDI